MFLTTTTPPPATGHFDRQNELGVQPFLFVKVSVSIDAMLKFDGDFDEHVDGDFSCKQTLTVYSS